jgi:HSP20 family protein
MTRNLTLPSRWSPNLFDDFRTEMNRVMEGLWDHEDRGTPFFAPRTNFAETDTAYEVAVELPGMHADDFEIEFKDDRLWITGERKHDAEEEGRTYHRNETTYGNFRRVIALGKDVDAESIEAKYENGVLAITISKIEAVKPKRIEVKS